MGVPRRFYSAFAAFLAQSGFAVLTIDYRGVADSHPGSRAALRAMRSRLTDWADRDLAAAVRELRRRFPDTRTLFIGHSIGGQLLGLLEDAPISGALLIGAQTLSWRHWDGVGRLLMGTFWFGVIPTLVNLLGYLPMKALRQGEDLPPEIARDWGIWGRTPDMLALEGKKRARAAFSQLDIPIRTYAISDDGYAPRRGVVALAALFERASVEIRDVTPRDLDVSRVGHFAFFRPAFADTLWAEACTWLARAASR
jgi:predicted alpha/beta hydrolase